MKIWDEKYETMPISELEQLQLERLQATLFRVMRHKVAFYRKKFDEIGFDPEEIESLKDLQKLPFTNRQDLKESYPYEMFAVPLREVVRIHSASGDMGIVGYTRNDLKNWSNLVARALCSTGIDENDKVQITLPYGLFPGAFGYHYAAELIGASVIPTSTMFTERQIEIIKDYRSTAIVCTPSYALRLIDEMRRNVIDPRTLNLKYAVLGSEPFSEDIREEIETGLFLSASFNYGVSSIFGNGIASECREKSGLHIFIDHYIPEIIDIETGEVLPVGEEGELVLTTLTREAFPIIRYRTGDITRLYLDDKPCSCNRTHIKMEPVKRRVDDLLVFKGMNIFPEQISEILMEVDGNEPKYRIVLLRKNGKDFMNIEMEVSENVFFDEMKIQKRFIEDIEEKIRRRLYVTAQVKLVEPGATSGKIRVEDRR